MNSSEMNDAIKQKAHSLSDVQRDSLKKAIIFADICVTLLNEAA